MTPSAFEYHKAESLEHAVALLDQFGEDGRPLAGGQSLVPMMNLRLARPRYLVDINGLGLGAIELDGQTLKIGALVRHEQYLSNTIIATHYPAFLDGVQAIGHPTIRRNGTTGGSLSHADPTAELPLLSILHDAQIVAASVRGERKIAATDFFEGAYMTTLQAGEMIARIELPIPPSPSAGAFVEFGERRGDFAIAAGAVTLAFADGRISRASVACSGAAQTAIRAPDIEAALVGLPIEHPESRHHVKAFAASLSPPDDHSASADYRRALIEELLQRAISIACARATETS